MRDVELEPFEKPAKDVKQVIVVRKDLNMRKGKIAAQVAHASLGAVMAQTLRKKEGNVISWLINVSSACPLALWLDGPFAKICVYVNSLEELEALQVKAKKLYVHSYMITDSGKTEFNGVPTKTCIAIGPDFVDRVDQITGDLPLL